MTSIVVSSGHGEYVRGASGILDEVDEARLVVEEVAVQLRARGVDVVTYHDDVSTTQNENLNRIVDFHNSKTRDLDISVHFNAYEQVEKPMGTEVLYVTHQSWAGTMSEVISSVGFINRGPKYRDDLFFLNNTAMPSLLFEICFVDSEADAEIYNERFGDMCARIADTLAGVHVEPEPDDGDDGDDIPSGALFHAVGKCSYFGGPGDTTGMTSDEGLAFIYEWEDAPHLFLPYQPEGSTGLARRLNPNVHYVACRWDYSITPKAHLLQDVALVRSMNTGYAMTAYPADWGPNENTDRVADLSPGLLEDLKLETDDLVEVIFPYRE